MGRAAARSSVPRGRVSVAVERVDGVVLPRAISAQFNRSVATESRWCQSHRPVPTLERLAARGAVLSTTPGSTLPECRALCASEPRCAGLTFQGTDCVLLAAGLLHLLLLLCSPYFSLNLWLIFFCSRFFSSLSFAARSLAVSFLTHFPCLL